MTAHSEAATAVGQVLVANALQVIRRSGEVVSFDQDKITLALKKAFLAVEGSDNTNSERLHRLVENLTTQIVEALLRQHHNQRTVHIETIQDQVELALMRAGEHKVARAYVLYREKRAAERAAAQAPLPSTPSLFYINAQQQRLPLDHSHLQRLVASACQGLAEVAAEKILSQAERDFYQDIAEKEIIQVLIMAARTLVEEEPSYSQVAARLLLMALEQEALTFLNMPFDAMQIIEEKKFYSDYFLKMIEAGVQLERLDPRLLEFDLSRLAQALVPERDGQFTYLGLQTLYDRYFLHHNNQRFELPQAFFMRVAMGLALNEVEREEKAIAFYQVLSRFDAMSSTPTLFNSGTLRPQLSSCYLTTVSDDLNGIYNAIKDNALLSKYAGGLGNDWSRVRGMGAHIKGTNGKSQGVVPFLKVVNDTAVAVNQCFAPDTLIHTAQGVQEIRHIKAGDLVLGISGRYREVKKQLTYNQQDAMLAVDVKHSISPLEVTDAHPFYAIQGVPLEQSIQRTEEWLAKGKVTMTWVEAGQLQTGDYVAQVIPREVVAVENFTVEDARLYGILLGDGHLTKDSLEWGVSGNPQKDQHLEFVKEYLRKRGIHYWVHERADTYQQIGWASGYGVLREATTGRFSCAGRATLPFFYNDLYNEKREKRISSRFSHLPPAQTLALLQGLLETDGGVSRNKEIYFTTTSQALAEGLRYQCLRLGVPTAGQYRDRQQDHQGIRSDGSTITFSGNVCAYDLRIPAVPEIATLVNCQPIKKRNWLSIDGLLFSRIRSVKKITNKPFVCDLIVEGDVSYMTTAALAHNGGKRKGAVCAYLETWHIDIEEFLELRKNTGDDRRRTHDMNTANWVPDLFMQRVAANAEWTLFSPDETKDLHDLTGQAFAKRYAEYEQLAEQGRLKISKKVKALDLWRKMLSMLYETGHPWITFKDPCNVRSPQQHVGVVHSSNLCTEITLNTSDEEIAVCNLASINLAQHIKDGQLDSEKLKNTIHIVMRMLDNIIDINYYSVPQARRSNLKHRPVGLGVMGFQDALYQLRIPYASEAAVTFADRSMEEISFYAIDASSDLAKERGSYATFPGSLWSQGILPIDSIDLLEKQRGEAITMDRSANLAWDALREKVKKQGIRNSNTMAIAPTATISNICGVTQSIEPTYQHLYVKSNLSGEFTVVNNYLVNELKKLGLWDKAMVSDLKFYDGSIAAINRIPEALRQLFAVVWDIEPQWLIEAASRRQKWLDQAQSLNLYMTSPSGKKLDQMYRLCWEKGLKTTYYLRTRAATQIEKSTQNAQKLNAVKLSVNPVLDAAAGDSCESCQ